MPNWCENDLVVTGKKEQLEIFRDKLHIGKTWLSEEALIPYPKEYADADKAWDKWVEANPNKSWKEGPKDGFNNGGYDWCNTNWGTKWGFREVMKPSFLDHDYEAEASLTYNFSSAWTPPIPLIKKAGELFPELDFELRYFESGAGFNGLFRMEKGKEAYNKSGPYFGDRGG